MSRSSKRIYQIIGYIIDYAPIILTVVASTIATLLAIQNITKTDQMLQWILLVLVLLSTTQLIDRFRLLRGLDTKIDNLLVKSTTSISGIKRVSESHQRIEDYRAVALSCKKEVVILGTALRNITMDLETLGSLADAGKKVRLLMLDPDFLDDNPDISLEIQRVIGLDNLSVEARTSVDRILAFNKKRSKGKALELGLYSAIPTIGGAVSDPGKHTSKMFFELFLYGRSIYNRPRFWLEMQVMDEISLYNHVLNLMEQLWKDAKKVNNISL